MRIPPKSVGVNIPTIIHQCYIDGRFLVTIVSSISIYPSHKEGLIYCHTTCRIRICVSFWQQKWGGKVRDVYNVDISIWSTDCISIGILLMCTCKMRCGSSWSGRHVKAFKCTNTLLYQVFTLYLWIWLEIHANVM